MERVFLVGADDVERAGRAMSGAADQMDRAARNMDGAADRLASNLDQHAQRIESAMAPPIAAPRRRVRVRFEVIAPVKNIAILDPFEGDVLLVATTVIESGAQGGEFFSVPCLVIDTGERIVTLPLHQQGHSVVVVENIPGASA
jgi:hypothetical protein